MNNVITFFMILTSIINILNIISIWKEKRNDKSDARFTSVESQVTEQDKRLSILEEKSKTAPTHADLEKVYHSINELSETVHKLVGQSNNQTALLNQLVSKAIGAHRD